MRCTHDLYRLVQHDIGKRGGQGRKPSALDQDDIVRKDAPGGSVLHHPVDLDSTGKNELIGLATGAIAGRRDEFVEPDPVLRIFR